MKKIIITCLIILSCLFIADVIHQSNNTKTVLLSGKVMGFNIDNYKEKEKYEGLIPISSNKLGIVTFIKKDTHEFSALGHSAIQDSEITDIEGICIDVDIDKIKRSYQNHLGYIHGIAKNKEHIGIVNKNNEFGIFGKIEEVEESEYKEIQTASKYEITLGKAELLIALENEEIESYQIEIVEINYLSTNKNIKIKIQDNELIEKTGGIVQGMSGTPIVQNGKLIGAINYANAQYPEEAYAIFIEKLI